MVEYQPAPLPNEEPTSDDVTAHPRYDYTITIPPTDPTKTRLDHIIILIPYAQLINPPDWLTRHFILSPGGQHADKKTENRLILFHDGSYIELIAFINDDPKHREGHWWGKKDFGIIDFAFTSDGDAKAHFEAIETRLAELEPSLASKYSYAPPVSGGRVRPDGTEVKWEVTFPKEASRGKIPFFCHDVTPRELRVPYSKEACSHPCMAYGLDLMILSIPKEEAGELASVYSAILGQENLVSEKDVGIFQLHTVRTVEGAGHPDFYVEPTHQAAKLKKIQEQGHVLGDLRVGGLSVLATDIVTRIDVEEDYGAILYKLALPPGLEPS